MLSLNVMCTVCKKAFQKSDAIYSTSCGHVFHLSCLNQWKSRSTSCPLCKSYNPTMNKIFLDFDESHEYEKVVGDLNAKLEIANNKFKELKEEKDKKIDDIKRLYNISEQWRAKLDDKILKLKNEHEVQNTNRCKEIEDVENLHQKISELSTEVSKLKKSLNESEVAKIFLNQKIEWQEERLKCFNAEFQKMFKENLEKEFMKEKDPIPRQRRRIRKRSKKHTRDQENKDSKEKSPVSEICLSK